MMSENQENIISEESASVQSHLSIMQSVITRMAANSTSCKTWCITIVSAILVLISDKSKPELAWLALIPTFLFMTLDAYYLGLEKAFRSAYNNFIEKLHRKDIKLEDLFSVVPSTDTLFKQLDALKSFSVWGFYLPLFILIFLARFVILV